MPGTSRRDKTRDKACLCNLSNFTNHSACHLFSAAKISQCSAMIRVGDRHGDKVKVKLSWAQPCIPPMSLFLSRRPASQVSQIFRGIFLFYVSGSDFH